ncbi:unnamed protein product [Nyctereutes procyonoides]|uniref:Ferritin n=1 Tax=Nyctereutes procyonoides TaxID=34880 RepID=A0A811ZE41_NYCPR|nr:unnamed protein product [Nyctereutes procyonoides]
MHLQASYTFLSLGFYFDQKDLALEGVDHFFQELAEEKNEDTQHPLKMQNYCSKMIGIKPWMPWKPGGPGENLKQALLDLHALGSKDHSDLHLCSFLENCFLSKQVKPIKKVVTTWLTSAG